MSDLSFWSRVKNARLFQVLVIYVAASWVVLQVVGLFIGTMNLPRWTMPWTLVLLAIGLVVILATAWVQSHPLTPHREAADEVPTDWELDVTGIKESVATGRLPHLNWARALVGGVFAFSILFGLAGLYVVIRDRGESFSPSEALAGDAAPGIAVLPFTVQGGGDLEVLGEGMVSLLSTGLDGAGGLRAIDNRTVLARWDEHVSNATTADLATALEVARAAGARYALVGSAVAVGPEVRLTADAYAVESGEQLGRASVEGSPDSLLGLVDLLAVDLLRVILVDEEELPEIDLAGLTTDSPEALRAYLEGQIQYRQMDLGAAVEAFERAVAIDSTFALAHAELGYAARWMGLASGRKHVERAARLIHRLPKREAVLVRATLDELHRTTNSVEPLREFVRLHPDDAEAWYRLGETYAHVPAARATPDEVEQIFKRAVDLDPKNLTYLVHYMEFAWWFNPDSVRAAERLQMYERVAPDHPRVVGARLALDLAFGDSLAQEAARARLPSVEERALVTAVQLLFHPRNRTAIAVHQEIYERGESRRIEWGLSGLYSRNVAWWGKLREGMPYLEDPEFSVEDRAFHSFWLFSRDMPIAEDLLQETLGPAAINPDADPSVVFHAGAFAVDQGRGSDHDRAMAELRRRAERAFAGADTTWGTILGGMTKSLEGYALWERGRPEAALPLLEDEQALGWGLTGASTGFWLEQVYEQLGRFRDAERLLQAFHNQPFSVLSPRSRRRLGRVYEALGEYDKAVEAYEYFVEYWADADPELQPMVEETRQAIIRLTPLQRE